MVFKKTINKLIKTKETLIKNKSLFLYICLIILFQIIMHFFVYSLIYKHVSFFCGDSPQYAYIANHLNIAAEDKPSGFPFILHLLSMISNSPSVLIVFSIIISTLTSIFFFLTLRFLFKNKNLIPFLIVIFFFLNPAITYVDSMVHMSDSFAFFLFSMGIFLVLVNKKNSGFNFRYMIAGLIFGYLTIIKSVFVYVSPFVILYIFYEIYKKYKEFSIKIILSFMIILVLFTSIPLSYMYLFNKPRLGVATLENFGGRSVFGNILPYLSCEQLLSIATTDEERFSFNQNCNNEEIKNSTINEQIWPQNSSMNRMGRFILRDDKRVAGNQLFQKWITAILLKYPTVVFYPIKNTIINGYLNKVIANQNYIKQPTRTDSGCEDFIPTFLNISKEDYIKGWYSNQQTNKFGIDLIAFMQIYLSRIMNWIIIILSFIVIPLYALYKKIIPVKFIFLYAISIIYLLIISIGSGYENRYFTIFNYLLLLSFSSLINSKKPELNEKDTNNDSI